MDGTDRCRTHLGPRNHHTLFKPEVADRLISMLRAGSYVQVACAAAGVSRQAYAVWMQRGNPENPRANASFRAFRERVELALAEAETVNVARVAAATRESWQAAAWLLERRHPERWARPSQREKEESPAPLAADHPADPFAEVDELAARRRQHG